MKRAIDSTKKNKDFTNDVGNLTKQAKRIIKTKKRAKQDSEKSSKIVINEATTNNVYNDKRKEGKQYNKHENKMKYKIQADEFEENDLAVDQRRRHSKKIPWRKNTSDFTNEEPFDLNRFFSLKEQSFNESVVESHSGIDHEFLNSKLKKVNISSNSIRDDFSNWDVSVIEDNNNTNKKQKDLGNRNKINSNEDQITRRKKLKQKKRFQEKNLQGRSEKEIDIRSPIKSTIDNIPIDVIDAILNFDISHMEQDLPISKQKELTCINQEEIKHSTPGKKRKQDELINKHEEDIPPKIVKSRKNRKQRKHFQEKDTIKETVVNEKLIELKKIREPINKDKESICIPDDTIIEIYDDTDILEPDLSICHQTAEIFNSTTNDSNIVIEIDELNQQNDESVLPQAVSSIPTNKYCFDLENEKLIILSENSETLIFGYCSLKVLHGKLEILGSIITKHSKPINIYSPRGSSLLKIKNITNDQEEIDFEEFSHLIEHHEDLKTFKFEITSAIFICSKTELKCIEKYTSQTMFPASKNDLPRVEFDLRQQLPVTNISPEWADILESVTSTTKLMITGGKGVGKSTFLRYAVNFLINKFDKVTVIDLDPGQSEFSVPGCLTVTTVCNQVFGLNFTHLQKGERSYLSNIDVGDNPRKYLKTIEHLMEHLPHSGVPTLINYMGFTLDKGPYIAASAVTIVRPTDIIQIQSRNSKKNFEFDLNIDSVQENCTFYSEETYCISFSFRKISSMADDIDRWSFSARQARELCVLAYFAQMVKKDEDSLISSSVPTYEIDLNAIKITDTDGSEIHVAVVNGNMVALCAKTEGSEIFNVLGYGIVRGVNISQMTLTLITPESAEVLENAFYLVYCSVSLPPSVSMTPDSVTGPLPYVMEGELKGLQEIIKRSYIPANKK